MATNTEVNIWHGKLSADAPISALIEMYSKRPRLYPLDLHTQLSMEAGYRSFEDHHVGNDYYHNQAITSHTHLFESKFKVGYRRYFDLSRSTTRKRKTQMNIRAEQRYFQGNTKFGNFLLNQPDQPCLSYGS